MRQDTFLFLVNDEIGRTQAMIDEARSAVDEDLIGTLQRRHEYGRTIYYCYRGKNALSPKVYLGDEHSPKYKQYKVNEQLLSEIEKMENNITLLTKLGMEYAPPHINIAELCDNATPSLLERDSRLQFIKEWKDATYENNGTPFPDREIYTRSGVRVRSKDECMAYDLFEDMGLVFRYDSIIYLDDELGGSSPVAADFIFPCFDKSLIILEHLGLLEKEWYAGNFTRKLQLYTLNGYDLNKSLFLTVGTKGGGVNLPQIHDVAHQIWRRIWQTFR